MKFADVPAATPSSLFPSCTSHGRSRPARPAKRPSARPSKSRRANPRYAARLLDPAKYNEKNMNTKSYYFYIDPIDRYTRSCVKRIGNALIWKCRCDGKLGYVRG